VLGFNGKRRRVVFRQLALCPQAVEQVEAELPPKRVFDHLAIPLASARAPDFDSAQDFFVHR
jgi:hypothetical protein